MHRGRVSINGALGKGQDWQTGLDSTSILTPSFSIQILAGLPCVSLEFFFIICLEFPSYFYLDDCMTCESIGTHVSS